MIIKVFFITVILLAIMVLGFGIKLLFDKNARLPSGSCNAVNNTGEDRSCGCGGGECFREEDISKHKKIES